MYDPLGLSIGTTNLVAARNGTPPVTRRSVLTLYPHCAPKVGVPEGNPYLSEPGVLMKGFVERIGDSVALVSADGSAHDPELLTVEALDAMVLAAGADVASSEITIAVPAYWKPSTVQALRDGLRTHVGFVRSGMAPRLISDAIASLTAVNSEVGLPASGVVGVLDFGGGGTSATLVDVAGDFELVSATMRYADFSGNEIDQELLLRVFEELGRGSGIDPASTAAVGQLGELREQCRSAKERLSTEAVTEIAAELGGRSCSLAVTRDELEDLIQDRLTGFIYAFDDMLMRHRKSWADLAAVVTVGGGARIPLVAERLSVHGRISMLTPSQPAVAAAAGALMLASRGEQLDIRTRTSVRPAHGGRLRRRCRRPGGRRRAGDRRRGVDGSRAGLVADRVPRGCAGSVRRRNLRRRRSVRLVDAAEHDRATHRTAVAAPPAVSVDHRDVAPWSP